MYTKKETGIGDQDLHGDSILGLLVAMRFMLRVVAVSWLQPLG